jgi:hypothetical protein
VILDPPGTRLAVVRTEPRGWLWGGTNSSRLRRRRQQWSKLPEEIDVAVMGNIASSSVTCCPQELDPLVLALCEGTKPPVWVDLMFDELAASLQLDAPLIVSHSVDASVLGHPSTPLAAPLGGSGFVGRHPFTTTDGSAQLRGCRGFKGGCSANSFADFPLSPR